MSAFKHNPSINFWGTHCEKRFSGWSSCFALPRAAHLRPICSGGTSFTNCWRFCNSLAAFEDGPPKPYEEMTPLRGESPGGCAGFMWHHWEDWKCVFIYLWVCVLVSVRLCTGMHVHFWRQMTTSDVILQNTVHLLSVSLSLDRSSPIRLAGEQPGCPVSTRILLICPSLELQLLLPCPYFYVGSKDWMLVVVCTRPALYQLNISLTSTCVFYF